MRIRTQISDSTIPRNTSIPFLKDWPTNSNLDRWSRRRGRWPLAHQHVPTTSISLNKVAIKSSTWWMILFSLLVICLFRSRANLFQVSFGRNGSSGSGSSIQKNASGCFLKFLNCIWLTSIGETFFCTTYHRPLQHWICKIPCISTRWVWFLNCPRTKQ